jgi:D-alanyl-D-alanine carboxypeptidase
MLIDVAAPFVTAKNWIVIDANNPTCVFGKNEFESKEVASLTKIMTCYTVFKLSERYGLSFKHTLI